MGYRIFNYSDNEEVNIGNELDMNHTQAIQLDTYYAIGPKYTDPYEADFDIMRDPCGNMAEFDLDDHDIRKVMSWLNRRRFYRFLPVYRNDEYADVYCMASFNCEVIRYGSKVVGFHIHMTTNAPFMFGMEETYKGEISSGTDFVIESTSDEFNYLYLDAYVTIVQGGDLVITNDLDPDYVVAINNASAGNTYHFCERLKQVEITQGSHPDFYDDFNFNYIRLVKTPESAINTFHSNLQIEVEWTCSPIRKVGVV